LLENDFRTCSKKVSSYLRQYIEILKLQIYSIENNDMEKFEVQSEAGIEAVRAVFSYKKTADALWKDISRIRTEKGGRLEAYSMDSYNSYIADIDSLANESERLNALCADKLKFLMGKYRIKLEGVQGSLSKISDLSSSPPLFSSPWMLDISI